MTWKPMETVPKDGPPLIDLWHKEYGRITDCWWVDGYWAPLAVRDAEFSHWMLPPEPPKDIPVG